MDGRMVVKRLGDIVGGRRGVVRVWKRLFSGEVKKSKIYTRTGDSGQSSLFNGERRSKDDVVFEALGSVDEANARIGLAREMVEDPELKRCFGTVQHVLFDAGAAVATPRTLSTERRLAAVSFDKTLVETLEKWTDLLDSKLPPLRNFILPGGGIAAAHIHLARTSVRAAERRVMTLISTDHVEPSVGIYLNRLSDYLFVAARYASITSGHAETEYRRVSS